MSRVAFELDALLEVHEVKLDLLRAAPQRQVRDEHVKEGRFSGAGFSGNERVLACSLADGEVLQLGRAGTPDRHAQFFRSFDGPTFALAGGDLGKGDFDTIRSAARLPHNLEEFSGQI